MKNAIAGIATLALVVAAGCTKPADKPSTTEPKPPDHVTGMTDPPVKGSDALCVGKPSNAL